MTNDHENAHRPLPVILRPVVDENSLSSWLVRHAAYYGVTGSFFAQWLMLGTCATFRPSGTIGWVCRRSRAYPKNSAAIQSPSSR